MALKGCHVKEEEEFSFYAGGQKENKWLDEPMR